MRLSAITDAILEEAVQAQESAEFDTHDVIFWTTRRYPRAYVQDLSLALDDQGDPFDNLHMAIGRRLDRLPFVRGLGKTRSTNVRGGANECERWRRMVSGSAAGGRTQ